MFTKKKNRFAGRRADRLAGPETLEQRRVLAAVLSMQGPTEALFEGERAEFTLRLSERSSRAEAVFVTTQPGTATLGVDYAAPPKLQVIFGPGETVKRFSINTLSEAVPRTEGRETFFVTATPANGSLSAALTRQVTIIDQVPKPSISVADITVKEGNAGITPATFTLTLGSAYPRAVTVAYATLDGSATVANSDYTAAAGQVTFLPGQTLQTVTVNVNGDRIAETDETFSLILSSPTNASISRGRAICTIVNDELDQPGFQVTLKFLDSSSGQVPQAVRTVAEQAVNRWAKIITGDLAAVTDNGIFIDDFEMSIQMGLLGGAPTDGPSNVLANARPTAFRDNGTGLPYAGITGLDPADIASPALLLDTITHEMGHAFGFTPGANVFSRWFVGSTFAGANALREYNSLFATTATGVPLQAGVLAHWDETVFGNELMTPFTTGAPEYISRITVGALHDMGYTVNYAAAETYVRPRVMSPQMAAATGVTTVSAFPTGSPSTPSKTPSPSTVQTKPLVDVMLSPTVKAVADGLKDAAKHVAVAAGTTGRLKVVPPKTGAVVTLPSRTGALGG